MLKLVLIQSTSHLTISYKVLDLGVSWGDGVGNGRKGNVFSFLSGILRLLSSFSKVWPQESNICIGKKVSKVWPQESNICIGKKFATWNL